MASLDDGSRSTFHPELNQPVPFTGSLPIEDSSTAPLPATICQLSFQPTSGTTRVLTGTLSGASVMTSQRAPVVIKGSLKGALSTRHISHQKRRVLVSLFGICMLFLVVGLTLFTVTPLGRDIGLGFNPTQFGSSLFHSQNANPNSLAAQATAVYFQKHDGFDPSASSGQTLTDGSSSRFWDPGQCTYWANLRYHHLKGYWVRWNGNADQWVAGAKLAGWNIWRTPHIPSIIVLMPKVQGAGGLGHVAVVESINADGSAHTSNMNWNGFSTTRVEYVDFTPGTGVYFIGHP